MVPVRRTAGVDVHDAAKVDELALGGTGTVDIQRAAGDLAAAVAAAVVDVLDATGRNSFSESGAAGEVLNPAAGYGGVAGRPARIDILDTRATHRRLAGRATGGHVLDAAAVHRAADGRAAGKNYFRAVGAGDQGAAGRTTGNRLVAPTAHRGAVSRAAGVDE